jgi:4-hydroxy-3-polyprenylbenzoate decarboxylase
MTEICDRVLRAAGPAILCSRIPKVIHDPRTCQPVRHAEAESRSAWARSRSQALREVGKLLAYLKEPEPPKGLKDAWDKLPMSQASNEHGAEEWFRPRLVRMMVWEGKDVDLSPDCRSSIAGRATWRR